MKNTRSQLEGKGQMKPASSTTPNGPSEESSPPVPQVKENGDDVVLAKIAEMPEPYNVMGARVHAIIRESAPSLAPRLWYGMPGYAKDGKVVCFFRGGDKFKERYMTLGFNDVAKLDDGAMWPIAYALLDLTAAEEERIAALIRKAAGGP